MKAVIATVSRLKDMIAAGEVARTAACRPSATSPSASASAGAPCAAR